MDYSELQRVAGDCSGVVVLEIPNMPKASRLKAYADANLAHVGLEEDLRWIRGGFEVDSS